MNQALGVALATAALLVLPLRESASQRTIPSKNPWFIDQVDPKRQRREGHEATDTIALRINGVTARGDLRHRGERLPRRRAEVGAQRGQRRTRRLNA